MNTSPRKNHAHGINLAVAQELTAARISADFTEESLAAALPFSLRSLQRYLKGESAIDVEVLSAFCAALGVSESEIVRRAQARRQPDALSTNERAEVDAAKDRIRRAKKGAPSRSSGGNGDTMRPKRGTAG